MASENHSISLSNGPIALLAWCLMSFLTLVLAPSSYAFQNADLQEAQVKQVMIRGLTFLRTGFPDKAAAVFAEGLKLQPDEATLLSSMADAQLALRDLGLAAFYIEGALNKEPNNVIWNRQALFIALEAGDATKAVYYSSQILALQPMDAATHLAHLDLLERLQLTSDATTYAEASLTPFFSDEGVQRKALHIFEGAGALSLAKMAAEHIVSITHDPDDMYKLASLQIQLGDLASATTVLETVLKMDPSNDEALQTLRSLNGAQTKESEFFNGAASEKQPMADMEASVGSDSLAFAEKLAGLNPNDEVQGAEMAEILLQTGRFSQLAAFATHQLEANPRHLKMWIYALQGLIEGNQTNDALQLAEDGLQLFPGYPPILFQYARILVKMDRFSDAFKAASSALAGTDSDTILKGNIEALMRDIQQHQ